MTAPRLETERLVLRPYDRDDIDDLVRLLADYEVCRYLAQVPYPYTRADAEAWIDQVRKPKADSQETVFAIVLRRGGNLIGSVGLHGATDGDELGYWLGKAHWGHGYATEAVAAVIDYGFARRQPDLIHAAAHLANRASGRVLEKTGFRYVRDQICRSPVRADFPAHRYELRCEEWTRGARR